MAARTHRVRTFYDPRMVCESGSYSPSGTKPKYVVEDWLELGLADVQSFEPIERQQYRLGHSERYVDGVFSGSIANGFGNRNVAIAESTRWTIGSMLAASRAALEHAVACSPSSGFHHAHYDSGQGFCTFNGLVITARTLLDEQKVRRVGILDCDWHYGDGTDQIISHEKLGSSVLHMTSGEEDFADAAEYLEWLEQSLDQLWNSNVDLILYQAGADAHQDDPLGGLLTYSEMAERDSTVFDYCRAKSIPIAWNLAGGYQRDAAGGISPVLEIHRATMSACVEIYRELLK